MFTLFIRLNRFSVLNQQFELLVMWSLFSEPIQKKYYAGWLSRSWGLSVACCLFAFLIPILVLISIGYSWNSYQYSLVQPNLSFQNYQATCLLSSGVVTYDSSFTNEPTTNSYQTFISAGGDGSDLIINAVVQSANISACNLLLYFQVTLSNRLPTIAVLPLQFYRNTANNALGITAVKEWGIIQTHLLSAIPQSSIVSGQGLLYFMNNTQRLTMTDTYQTYGMNKNVSLTAKIGGSQVTYGSVTSSMSYQGRFTVQATTFLQEVSLLSNLRTFVPHFMYLFILLWVFLAQPTVRWMLQNKIYRSKVSHHKVKQH